MVAHGCEVKKLINTSWCLMCAKMPLLLFWVIECAQICWAEASNGDKIKWFERFLFFFVLSSSFLVMTRSFYDEFRHGCVRHGKRERNGIWDMKQFRYPYRIKRSIICLDQNQIKPVWYGNSVKVAFSCRLWKVKQVFHYLYPFVEYRYFVYLPEIKHNIF